MESSSTAVRTPAQVARPLATAPVPAGALSELRPAQRGFFARVREAAFASVADNRPVAVVDDAITRLRPAAASGFFARVSGRIERLTVAQHEHAQALLAQVRTAPAAAVSAAAAQAARPAPDGIRQLALLCANEWPDQVFDRVVARLQSDAALRQRVADELAQGPGLVDDLLRTITQACRASDTFSLRSASRARAILAGVLAVAGDAQAGEVIARLRSRFGAVMGTAGTPPVDRLAALQALAGDIQGVRLVTRRRELDALQADVAQRIQALQDAQKGEFNRIQGLIDGLTDKTAPLGQRIAQLEPIRAAIVAAAGTVPQASRDALMALLYSVTQGLQAETREAPQRAFALLRGLDPALDKATSPAELHKQRAILSDLQQAVDTCPGLAAETREASRRALAWTSDQLAVLEKPVPVLAQCRQIATEGRNAACGRLAARIGALPTAEYTQMCRRLQVLVDGIDPSRRDEALVALARAVMEEGSVREGKAGESDDRTFRESFCPALLTDPEILGALFKARDWRDEVTAFALAVVDDEEQAVLAGVPEACERRKAAGLGFEAQRLRIDARHNQLLVSDELDRLFQLEALRDGKAAMGKPRAGLASLFTAVAPSKELIDGLRRIAPEAVENFDLRIVQWIRLSATSGLITQAEAQALFKHVTARAGVALNAEEAARYIDQGFASTGDVVRCRQALVDFARKLKASALVSEVDRRKDPLFYADYVVRQLIERITGLEADEVEGPAVTRAIEARLQLAERRLKPHDDWVRAYFRRDEILLGLRVSDPAHRPTEAAQAPCGWMLDPHRFEAARPTLERLVDYLSAMKFRDELQGDAPEVRESRAALDRRMAKLWAHMQGLNVRDLSVDEENSAPPPQKSLAALLPLRDVLEELLNVQGKLVRLQASATEQVIAYNTEMRSLIEQISQIALLQEALVRQVPDFRLSDRVDGMSSAGNQVVKRMASLGLRADRFPPGTPAKAVLVRQVEAMTTEGGRYVEMGELASLCAALDPSTARAKVKEAAQSLVTPGGRRRSTLVTPQAPVKATAAAGPVPGVRRPGFLDKLKKAAKPSTSSSSSSSASASAAPASSGPEVASLVAAKPAVPAAPRAETDRLAQRMGALQPGEAFAVRFGRYGDQVVSQPVLPGLSVQTRVGAERSDGIHIQRLEAGGYEVEVVGRREVRFGVALKAFNESLGLSADAARSSGRGLRFHFQDRATCESMVRSLGRGTGIDLLAWRGARVDQVEQAGLSGRLEASIDLGMSDAIASARAAVSAEAGVTREVRHSGPREDEIVTRHVALIAEAHAAAAMGRVAGDVERGLDRTVTRHVIRQQGLLQEGSRAVFRARVVDGRVPQTLGGLMPGLSPRATEVLAERIGEVDAQGELLLQCRLTPAATGEANAYLRRARQALTDAALTVDPARREAARQQAREAAVAAEAVLQKGSSYAIEGLYLRRQSAARAEASRAVFKNFATSEDESVRSIDLSVAEGGMPLEAGRPLPASYDRWLALAPATAPALAS